MIARTTIIRPYPPRGHTLIELMVAIVIGMILVIAAFSVMATFEGGKRTTTAMNDALQSGNFGLYEIDKLVRSAGSGIARYGAIAGYGCALNYTPTNGTTSAPLINSGAVALPSPFNNMIGGTSGLSLRLAPSVIFPSATTVDGSTVAPGGAAAGSDALLLMQAGAGFGEVPFQIGVAAVATLTSTVGFVGGEWVLVGTGGIGQCMITQVAAGFNYAASATPTPFLPLNDLVIGAATAVPNDYVVALGSGTAVNFNMYAVGTTGSANADSLLSVDLLNSDLTTVQKVSDDIVIMRAVYGVDPTNSGTLVWTNPVANVSVSGTTYNFSPSGTDGLLTGATKANTALQSIKAIRIAMIVRAAVDEKVATNLPTSFPMFSSLQTVAPTIPVTWYAPSGANYRYREIETTIPLRNNGLF